MPESSGGPAARDDRFSGTEISSPYDTWDIIAPSATRVTTERRRSRRFFAGTDDQPASWAFSLARGLSSVGWGGTPGLPLDIGLRRRPRGDAPGAGSRRSGLIGHPVGA